MRRMTDIKIEDGKVVSIDGATVGGDCPHLYLHNFTYHWDENSGSNPARFTCQIISSNPEKMSRLDVGKYIQNNGFNSAEKLFHLTGYKIWSGANASPSDVSNNLIIGAYYNGNTFYGVTAPQYVTIGDDNSLIVQSTKPSTSTINYNTYKLPWLQESSGFGKSDDIVIQII